MDNNPILISILTAKQIELMNKLKQVLKQQGRSQKWFAGEIGKTENTISLWVLNKVQPSIEDLYRAAELLQVEATDLLEKVKDINKEEN
jgi:transcriptional regulator with XRE-family HTH domain